MSKKHSFWRGKKAHVGALCPLLPNTCLLVCKLVYGVVLRDMNYAFIKGSKGLMQEFFFVNSDIT